MIIIGTGAGGGTLAHRLAPTGKRILLLERGGYLPREPENWDSQGGLPQGALPHRRGVDRQGRRALPPAPAVLRRRQHEVLRRDPVPPARARLRRGPPLRRRLAGVADRPTTTSSPTTPRPSGSTSSTARRGEDPTEPPRSGPVPATRPSRTSRASSSSTTTSRAPATTRSTCRSASTSTRRDPEGGRCVRCDRFDGFPCLTDGKADAHVLCVRPALEHANVTLRTHAQRRAARDRRERALGHRGRRRPPRARGALQRRRRRRLLRRGQLGGAAAALGVATRTRTGSPTPPTWSAATTWPTSTRA